MTPPALAWCATVRCDRFRELLGVLGELAELRPPGAPAAVSGRRHIVEIWRSPQFLEDSGRYQLVTRQDDDGTKLLKEFPRQGCYDYWLRLERANLTFHPLDKEALTVCRALWTWEQVSPFQRDALERANAEQERRMELARLRQERRQNHFGIVPVHAPLPTY